MSDHRDDKLIERNRALFEQSVTEVDGRIRSRLNQARQAALAELRVRPRITGWVTAAAGAVALTLIVLLRTGSPSAPVEVWAEDVESPAADADVELLEDVEFYAWLAQQPVGRVGGEGA